MKLFTGSSNTLLAEQIASVLKTQLSPREIFLFPDGERRIQIQDNVLDQDCVIIQPTSTPADINYMELFFIADGLQRSGAKSTIAVIPYLGYQRQDHVFRDGEAVSLEVIVKTLEAVGIDRVIAYDLHSIRIPEVFKIPVSHLSALPLFAEVITKKGWHTKQTVLVSPDTGGIRRIKKLSQLLDNMPYAVIEKKRDLASGHVKAVSVDGQLAKRAIMVDDMISSGSTMIKAAELLKKRGVEEVYVFATHGVFSSEAPQVLQASEIKTVFVTDTVFIAQSKKFLKLEVISVAHQIGEELERLGRG